MRPAKPTAAALRRARTTVAGLACLLLTVVMHSIAGGGMDVVALVFCAPLAFAFGSLLVRLRHRLLALAGGLLATQALLHLVLSATCAPSVSAAAHPRAPAMAAAHLVAAVLAAVALRHADKIAESWLRFLTLLRHPLPELAPAGPHVAPAITALSPVAAGRLAWAPTGSRSPPAS